MFGEKKSFATSSVSQGFHDERIRDEITESLAAVGEGDGDDAGCPAEEMAGIDAEDQFAGEAPREAARFESRSQCSQAAQPLARREAGSPLHDQ